MAKRPSPNQSLLADVDKESKMREVKLKRIKGHERNLTLSEDIVLMECLITKAPPEYLEMIFSSNKETTETDVELDNEIDEDFVPVTLPRPLSTPNIKICS